LISGFARDVNEKCALLGCYAANNYRTTPRKYPRRAHFSTATGNLNEDPHAFMVAALWILPRMTNIWDKSCRKKSKHMLCSTTFLFENRSVYETVTGDNIIRRMRIACWITKATDTHSEHTILIAFPRQHWLRERASMLRYTYSASLVWPGIRKISQAEENSSTDRWCLVAVSSSQVTTNHQRVQRLSINNVSSFLWKAYVGQLLWGHPISLNTAFYVPCTIPAPLNIITKATSFNQLDAISKF
jgi:hypothetical protein